MMLTTSPRLNPDAFVITLDGVWIPKHMITGRTRDGSYITTNGQVIKP